MLNECGHSGPSSTATSLLSDRGRAAAPMDTPPSTDSIRDEPSLHPITAEMKPKPHPQTSPFTPHSGNPSREQQHKAQGGGQDKDSLVPLGHKPQASAAPSSGTGPCRARSWTGSLWSFPNGDIAGLSPGLLSPCSPSSNCCSGLAQSSSWAQPGSPALGRSLQLPLRAKG